MLEPGRVVDGYRDRYRVEKQIAVGGQCRVYLVRSLSSGEKLVLRIPRVVGDELDGIRIWCLRNAASILKILDHPGVEKYVDEGCVQGLPILITKYIEGTVLRKSVAPIYRSRARVLVIELLETLSYMHSKGVVHKDLKPSNVMVSSRSVIIDFSVAKRIGYGGVNLAVKSPGGYSAPEVVLYGLSLPQSDLWSLGGLALFLATGGRDPLEYLEGYPYAPRLRIDKLEKDIDDDGILRLVEACLCSDISGRPASASEALEILVRGKARSSGPRLSIFGTVFPLKSGRAKIGRHPSCDIYIPPELDPYNYVSRFHAEIYQAPNGKWMLRDLGSKNRTAIYREGRWVIVWSGRHRVSDPVELRNGDIIALGYSETRGPYITAVFYEE